MKVHIPIKRMANYSNFAFVLWSRFNLYGSSVRSITFGILNRYNLLPLDSRKQYHRYIGGEMDLMEFAGRVFYFGGNNGDLHIPSYNFPKTSVTNQIAFCSRSGRTDVPAYFDWYDPDGLCNTDTYDESLVEVTYGYEWTPAGKKWIYKVKDTHHDEWRLYSLLDHAQGVVYPVTEQQLDPPEEDRVRLVAGTPFGYYGPRDKEDGDSVSDGWVATYYDKERDLLKKNIQHLPGFLELVSWGGSRINQDRAYVDYIRVFRPVDRYSTLIPVYQ